VKAVGTHAWWEDTFNTAGESSGCDLFRDFANHILHHNDPVAFKTFVVLSWLGCRTNKGISPHLLYFPTVETVVVEICELGYDVVWEMLAVINLDTVRTQ